MYKILFSLSLLCISDFKGLAQLKYPQTMEQQKCDTLWSTTVCDPYRWLEGNDQQVKDWIKAQNNLSMTYFYNIPFFKFIKRKLEVLGGYYNPNTFNKEGKYLFKVLYDNNTTAAKLFCKKSEYGDFNELISPYSFGKEYSLSGYSVSPDNKYLLFTLSKGGTDWDELRIYDFTKGKYKEEVLTGLLSINSVWKGDGFYYLRYNVGSYRTDKFGRISNKSIICYHKIGQDQQKDEVMSWIDSSYTIESIRDIENSDKFLVKCIKERGGKIYTFYKIISTASQTESVKDIIVIPGSDFHYLGCARDSLYFYTNYKAVKGQVVKTAINDVNKFKTIIPQYQETLDDVKFIDNRFFCIYKNFGTAFGIIFDSKGKVVREIDFPQGAAVRGFDFVHEGKVYFYMSSFTFPSVFYSINLNTYEMKPEGKTEINFYSHEYTVKKVTYRSFDSTEVPMFIAHKKDLKINGKAPLLLYGYGGFNVSMDPFFDPGFIFFMEMGGIVALPCIRGGGELGTTWHSDGSRLNKKASFYDFIYGAKYFIDKGYTKSDKIAINGGSNGGLLVAACLNLAPELFKVGIIENGILDMIRYERFTFGEWFTKEYGTIKDSTDFKNLISYSPVQNINKGSYFPAVLVVTGENDTRVPPFHCYKYMASLQKKYSASKNPLLVYTMYNAGHGDPAGYWDSYTKASYFYGFLMHNLGINYE